MGTDRTGVVVWETSGLVWETSGLVWETSGLETSGLVWETSGLVWKTSGRRLVHYRQTVIPWANRAHPLPEFVNTLVARDLVEPVFPIERP